jgi:hypothetical protein
MNILVLNMPYKRNIIRKYSCSFHAVGFLYPPVELLRVATIIKQYSNHKHSVKFYDAIADKHNNKTCINKIAETKPDIIISLASVDFINDEIIFLEQLKKRIESKIVLIGKYLIHILAMIINMLYLI